MAKKKFHSAKASKGDMLPMYSDAMAGMPQEVMMKSYRNENYASCPEYPDTYSEKNKEYDAMIAKMNKQSFRGV